jgi:sialate O-acetylesterase
MAKGSLNLKIPAFMAGIIRNTPKPNPAIRDAQQNDKGLTGALKWYDPNYEPANWHKFWLPGYWADQGVKDLKRYCLVSEKK